MISLEQRLQVLQRPIVHSMRVREPLASKGVFTPLHHFLRYSNLRYRVLDAIQREIENQLAARSPLIYRSRIRSASQHLGQASGFRVFVLPTLDEDNRSETELDFAADKLGFCFTLNQSSDRTRKSIMQSNQEQAKKQPRMDRRTFVQTSSMSVLPLLFEPSNRHAIAADASQSPSHSSFPGLITREHEPENREYPFSSLDRWITPNDRFFVRCHFPVPKLDPTSWRLTVEGAVTKPLTLTLADLRKMPSQHRAAIIECAGNGRVFLVPKARGVGWELGAASNAEWTGVPLAALLEQAGVKKSAVDVILEGADKGEIRDDPKSPGIIPYARSLPIEKAKQPEVLLAYQMNGTDLPPVHGFPLRAVVSGWYGMASVKWLTRIVVTDRPYLGYFQTFDYTYFERRNGLASMVPITEMQVKAEIARPMRDEVVTAGAAYRVFGAAWTGDTDLTKVEISVDGGKSWQVASLQDKPVSHAWRMWEYQWQVPTRAGRYQVMARATDGRGRVQPMQRDPDLRNYMISHVIPIEVDVR